MNMKELNLLLPEDTVEYLKTKFPKKEEAEAYIADLIHFEMRIDLIKPVVQETSSYRLMRRNATHLYDEEKDITAEALATRGRVKVNVAREWLHRMEKDAVIELVNTDSRHRKHFKLIERNQTSK